MTQTLSPDTGEIRLAEDPTTRLTPPVLRRPDAEPFDKTAEIRIPQTIGVVDGFATSFGDTPPPPPRPLPAPKAAKVLMPLLRPAAPDETYAQSRARRGLPPVRPGRGYVGRHRAPDDAPPVINGAASREWPYLVAKLWNRGGTR